MSTTNLSSIATDLLARASKQALTAYLSHSTGTPFTTTKDIEHANLHEGCRVLETIIPAGTPGLLFRHDNFKYSATVWVGDEEYPAKGSTRTLVSRAYTFIADVNGKLVSSYKKTL